MPKQLKPKLRPILCTEAPAEARFGLSLFWKRARICQVVGRVHTSQNSQYDTVETKCWDNMHLPDEAYNWTITAIWTTFSEDRRDKRTDDLPMMDSITWPIGAHIKNSYLKVTTIISISGIGILDVLVALGSKSYRWRWWYPHIFDSTNEWDQIWNCLVFMFSITQSAMCFIGLCLTFHGLLWSTGM